MWEFKPWKRECFDGNGRKMKGTGVFGSDGWIGVVAGK